MKKKEKYQQIIITLDDGEVVTAVIKAFTKKKENRKIMKIQFTEPKDMPKDVSWGLI